MARLRPAAASVRDLQALNRPRLRRQGARRAGAGNPLIHVFAAVILKPRRGGNSFGRLGVAELVGKITEGRDQTQSRDPGFWFEP